MRHVHVEKERRHDVMLGKSCDEKTLKAKRVCLKTENRSIASLPHPKKGISTPLTLTFFVWGFSDEETLKTYGLTKERGKGEAHKEKS